MQAIKINVLLTGGGAPGSAGIINCLKQDNRLRIVSCDQHTDVVGKILADDFFLVPNGSHENYGRILLEECKKREIKIVLPLVTAELFALSRLKTDFEKAGIMVLVTEPDWLEIANNKGLLYKYLSLNGFDLPKFRLVNEISEVGKALSELGYPHQDVCFKPFVSNGSRGFRVVSNKTSRFDLLFGSKPGSAFITHDEAISVLSEKSFPPLLFAQYLIGKEYSVDCLAHHGKCLMALPRLRSKMVEGISVKGVFEKNEDLIKKSEKIISMLHLHGNIGIQFREDEHGKAGLLEVNPRVQGTISAALGAGVNLPLLAIYQELGMSFELPEVKWNTGFIRHWSEVFYN